MITTSHSSLSPPQILNCVLLALAALLSGCAANKPPAKPKEFAFWPALPNEPHVQFLVAYQSSADIQAARSALDEMLYGKSESLPIVKPYGVAMRNGRIYVCDVRIPGLTVLDLPQRQTRVLGVSGSGAIQKAVDIAIAPDGTKYVVDQGRSGIVVFDANDHFITFLAPKDLTPVSVAIHDNELFVSDFAAQTIKVLNRMTGQVLRTIGQAGTGDGQFTRPLCVRLDQHGNLLVTDVIRCRILRFKTDGTFIGAFGEMGNRPGDFVRPKHMAVDRNGLLYVVDAGFSNVQIFDEEYRILDFFGSSGTHPGSMELPAGLWISEDPADVALFKDFIHPAFQAERLIIVTNQWGPNRVAVYAQGQLRPGKTIADIIAGRADTSRGTKPEGATRPTTFPTGLPAPEGDESTQPAPGAR